MNDPYLNSSLPVADRVDDLLSRMTLAEKVGQMMQLPALDAGYEDFIERYHLGSYLHCLGDDITRLQALNRDKSRLGIPLIFAIDAIHGHCLEDLTTVFPVQLAMACSWNPDLLRVMGRITAGEARSGNLHWTFSPVLCMGRDPRWGRTSETFGEDPLLVTELAAALTEGYQTADYPLAACAKHYAAYGETDGGRDSSDAHVSERQLRNLFLPAFERQVAMGCKTFMAGYQSLNGIPCSANTWLMDDILREEWGYDGVVVTDWNNCGQMLTLQQAAANLKEAVAQCLEASNDIFMATPEVFEYAQALVREGRVSEARIDASVRRILKLKFELGLFEEAAGQSMTPDRATLLADPARWQTALEASRQTLTLVRNNGVLPLSADKHLRILLVGDNADNCLNQLGDWSFIPGMTAYTDTKTHRADTVTLYQSLQAFADEGGISLRYLGADYCGPESEYAGTQVFIDEAAKCDVIVFCAGDALKQYGEFHDRADLQLPGNQQAVFDCLRQQSKPLVSVLLMSKPHCVTDVVEKSDSVLVTFNPGAKGGIAIRECLFGEFNPSGRLPISFPRHVGQIPVCYNQAPGWHAVLSPHHTYDQPRYLDLPQSPLLAFGEGMGYSRVRYGEACLSAGELCADGSVTLTVPLTNEGGFDALEVVQLYVHYCIPGVTTPVRQLLSFKRLEIAAGGVAEAQFELQVGDFHVWNKTLERKIYSGTLALQVGCSSRLQDLQTLELNIR